MKVITAQSYNMTNTKKESIFNDSDFQKLIERVSSINPDAKRQWGKMNVTQMLNHLKIATASGLCIYKLHDESSWMWRNIIKFMALWFLKRLPKNTKAAEGFKSEMNMPLDFNLEKVQVILTLQKAHNSNNEIYPHPMFGKMSKKEWGRLIYRHFDHHLRQFSN